MCIVIANPSTPKPQRGNIYVVKLSIMEAQLIGYNTEWNLSDIISACAEMSTKNSGQAVFTTLLGMHLTNEKALIL